MNQKQARELWKLRFLRILQLEEESFEFYRRLLKQKSSLLAKGGVQPILKEILRDEGRHIRIAKELLRLVDQKSNERKTERSAGLRKVP